MMVTLPIGSMTAAVRSFTRGLAISTMTKSPQKLCWSLRKIQKLDLRNKSSRTNIFSSFLNENRSDIRSAEDCEKRGSSISNNGHGLAKAKSAGDSRRIIGGFGMLPHIFWPCKSDVQSTFAVFSGPLFLMSYRRDQGVNSCDSI